jgi:hypothetical protein
VHVCRIIVSKSENVSIFPLHIAAIIVEPMGGALPTDFPFVKVPAAKKPNFSEKQRRFLLSYPYTIFL